MADDDRDFDDQEDEEEEDDSDGRSGRRSSRGGPPRRYGRRPRFCQFCAENTKLIDYKQVDLLRRFLTENAKMRNRRQTGTCARHQRMVARAVKRARHMALLPFEGELRR
jgi:small subunit ribosomal protein S18